MSTILLINSAERSARESDLTPARTALEACADHMRTHDVQTAVVRGRRWWTDGHGRARLATWRERLAYRIAGTMPRTVR